MWRRSLMYPCRGNSPARIDCIMGHQLVFLLLVLTMVMNCTTACFGFPNMAPALDKHSNTPVKTDPLPVPKVPEVLVATSTNFDDLVTNSGRDTFIEFYAPWCIYCVMLAQIYGDLAEMMKDENINIIKMDATAYPPPSPYKVEGYPALYWKPAGGNPVKYQGGSQLKDFIKFIAKSSTNELKGFDRNGNPKQG